MNPRLEALEMIAVQVDAPIATVTLNRPEKLNAMNVEMRGELQVAIGELEDDEAVRAIVLRGAGRAFSAGFDMTPRILRERKADPRLRREASDRTYETFWSIWNSRKPYVAAVHGPCMAGALDLALACDLTICSDDAVFGAPEVQFGGSSPFLILPFVVGMKAAKYILLTGRRLDAQTALRLGIVTEVVGDGRVFEAAEELARWLAKLPLGTIELNKRSLHRAYRGMGLDETVQMSHDVEIVNWLTPNDEQLRFQRYADEHGLKAAIEWRDAQFGA